MVPKLADKAVIIAVLIGALNLSLVKLMEARYDRKYNYNRVSELSLS